VLKDKKMAKLKENLDNKISSMEFQKQLAAKKGLKI